MRAKNVAWVVTAALLLGLFALPASANKVKDKDGVAGGLKDTGFLFGNAMVGKLRDRCLHDGASNVRGSGIGLPHQTKNAYWELGNSSPAVVTSLAQPGKIGLVRMCGRLTKMFSAIGGGLGAACDTSKGWDGRGTIAFLDDDDPSTPAKDTIWLKELGWKASATTFVMTGVANQAPNEGLSKGKGHQDLFLAVIQAQGAAQCPTKSSDKRKDSEEGARFFTVNGIYTIANGPYIDPNTLPLMCKSGLANSCLYDPKKTGKSG